MCRTRHRSVSPLQRWYWSSNISRETNYRTPKVREDVVMFGRKAIIAVAGLALVAGAALAQQKTIAIGPGGTGGVYYPLGGGLANVLSKTVPGMQATAEVTGGSVDNLKLIGSGQSELGF